MIFTILKFFDKHNGNSDDLFGFLGVEILVSHVRDAFSQFFPIVF